MAQGSELRLLLERTRAELVRAFVREAFLGEEVPTAVASLIADDTAQAWEALCHIGSGRERARIQTQRSRREVASQVFLPSHARFSQVGECLSGRLRPEAGISLREHGIDGWEISIHRNLIGQPLPASTAEEATAGPAQVGSIEYSIDLPQKADAAAIARCFLAVYGHHYVHPEVLSPQRYWDQVESGELIPVIARDSRGEVVGHVALERRPETQVAERGEAVVLSSCRGHGLLERMTECLSELALKHDLEGIYAEPVTIHTFSQRNDERAGMPVCALLLGVNPENVGPRDIAPVAAGQRQSYLRTFRFLRTPTPRTIVAPAPYREVLAKLYAALGVPVSILDLTNAPSESSRTAIRVNGRGYGVISFHQVGHNAGVELAQAMRDIQAFGASSIQLSAHLDDPGLALLTGAARDLGFFFCGLGPGFAGRVDLLQLQYLSEAVDTSKLQLFTDLSRELVAFVEADRATVEGSAVAREAAITRKQR